MINNEVMRVIMTRNSYKMFDGKPIGNEELDTIIQAGLHAPTGMNGQPWHFTVIKSPEMLARVGKIRRSLPLPPHLANLPAPPPGVPAPGSTDPMRNAPVLILVSGRESHPTNHEDCVLAMENMFLAAWSLGIGSGWDHAMVRDFFNTEGGKAIKPELIPEGFAIRAAAFFGYPVPMDKDKGPRKGTVAYL